MKPGLVRSIRAWRARDGDPAIGRFRAEHAFLPAALEVVERPPSPLGRGLAWTVILLVILALTWSARSELDIVSVARGKIVPVDRTRVIRAMDLGMVQDIRVVEGQRVAPGELLVALDASEIQAEEKEIRLRRERLRGDRARLTRLLSALSAAPESNGVLPVSAGGDLQQRRFQAQMLHLQKRRDLLSQRLAQQQAEVEAAGASARGLGLLLPLIERRVDNLESLADRKMAPEQQLLALKQERITIAHRLEEERARLAAASARERALQEEIEVLLNSAREVWITELAEIESLLETLEQQHLGLKSRIRRRILRAPIDGVVQQIRVRSPGDVINPGEVLMTLVPDKAPLEVEAWMAGNDIGFVRVGQRADVKVDAFPFTRYGTLHARLHSLSADTVEHETLGQAYRMGLLLEPSAPDMDNPGMQLIPGMEVTVEVRTGGRRLMEYFLSTLLRYRDEALRER